LKKLYFTEKTLLAFSYQNLSVEGLETLPGRKKIDEVANLSQDSGMTYSQMMQQMESMHCSQVIRF
jgi:hypothetical protein